jgi:hypothetical protein
LQHGCCRGYIQVVQVPEQQCRMAAALPATDVDPDVAGKVNIHLRGPCALRQLHQPHHVADVALDLRMGWMACVRMRNS